MRNLHTFIVLEVTEATFNEIRDALGSAGYDHAFVDSRDEGTGVMLDMHTIAIVQLPANGRPRRLCLRCLGDPMIQHTCENHPDDALEPAYVNF